MGRECWLGSKDPSPQTGNLEQVPGVGYRVVNIASFPIFPLPMTLSAQEEKPGPRKH